MGVISKEINKNTILVYHKQGAYVNYAQTEKPRKAFFLIPPLFLKIQQETGYFKKNT